MSLSHRRPLVVAGDNEELCRTAIARKARRGPRQKAAPKLRAGRAATPGALGRTPERPNAIARYLRHGSTRDIGAPGAGAPPSCRS